MMNVVARLERPNTPLLPRMLSQIEARLVRNQLRLSQVLETTWACFQLNGSLQGELTDRLLVEIERRAHMDGPAQINDALRLLGSLPMRRPWPLIEPLAFELRQLGQVARPAAHRLPPTAHRLPPTAHRLPPTAHRRPTAKVPSRAWPPRARIHASPLPPRGRWPMSSSRSYSPTWSTASRAFGLTTPRSSTPSSCR